MSISAGLRRTQNRIHPSKSAAKLPIAIAAAMAQSIMDLSLNQARELKPAFPRR